MDDFPLPARTLTTLAWSGSEVFLVGGGSGGACPPTADCEWGEFARDGAAFDPVLGTWRVMREAPIDIPPSPAAFAGGRLFISVTRGSSEPVLLAYDVAADRWDTLDAPDSVPRTLVADGDRVLFLSGSDEHGTSADLVLNAISGRWSELPPDPLGLTFDRLITPTPTGLVLTAKELVPSPGSDEPALTIAALYHRASGRWARLPDTRQIGGWTWMWTGSRLVDPHLGGSDGGEVGSWGRTYPHGGSISLPDGSWSPLTDPPAPLQDAWISEVISSGRFALSGGYLYDDERDNWTVLGRPDGAALEAGPALWADEKLVVLSGADGTSAGGTVSQSTWMYTPPA